MAAKDWKQASGKFKFLKRKGGERSYGFQVSWQGVGFIQQTVWLLGMDTSAEKLTSKKAISFEFWINAARF